MKFSELPRHQQYVRVFDATLAGGGVKETASLAVDPKRTITVTDGGLLVTTAGAADFLGAFHVWHDLRVDLSLRAGIIDPTFQPHHGIVGGRIQISPLEIDVERAVDDRDGWPAFDDMFRALVARPTA